MVENKEKNIYINKIKKKTQGGVCDLFFLFNNQYLFLCSSSNRTQLT